MKIVLISIGALLSGIIFGCLITHFFGSKVSAAVCIVLCVAFVLDVIITQVKQPHSQ
jgi:FtsH-binding integral membrane protein